MKLSIAIAAWRNLVIFFIQNVCFDPIKIILVEDIKFKIGLGRMETTKQANSTPNSAVTCQSLN